MKEIASELNILVKQIKEIQRNREKQLKTNIALNNKIKTLMNKQNLFLKKLDSISNLL